MSAKPPKYSPLQRRLRTLASEIQAKTVRLRNKAALVAGEPVRGRNLTALRNTLRELQQLAEELDRLPDL